MRSQSLRGEDGFATALPARAEAEGNGIDSATPLLQKSPFVLPLGMLPCPFLGFDVSIRADFSLFPSYSCSPLTVNVCMRACVQPFLFCFKYHPPAEVRDAWESPGLVFVVGTDM